MNGEDYYKVLSISESANQNDIKKAYHKLAVKYHPDKNSGDKQAEETFKKISEAYYTLGDEKRRQEYDQIKRMGGFTGNFSSTQGFDFSELLRGFSAGNKGSARAHSIFNGLFEDIFSSQGGPGANRTYRYSTNTQRSQNTSQSKQLDTDMLATLPISQNLADNGGEVNFALADNRKINLKIPPNTKDGQKLRLKDQGNPCQCCGKNGDLIVTITIKN